MNYRYVLTLVVLLNWPVNSWAQGLQHLYDEVYQILIKENETNQKVALGSGFRVSKNGLVISNYHVVSNMVFEPDNHHIEYLDKDGKSGDLRLLHFDVINDLALMEKVETDNEESFLAIAEAPPQLGDTIFAIGNPHDIGMLIVDGAYNGLADSSYNDQILFSGSLNSGMSGGPAVDEAGQLIGVNVATAGSQLSFLVPADKVRQLIDKQSAPLDQDAYLSHIQTQIETYQRDYFGELLELDWPLQDLGNQARVAGEMGLDTTCWGESNETNEDATYLQLSLHCGNNNRIYLNPGFNTGVLYYSFFYYETEELNANRFHEILSDTSYWPDNSASDEEVSEYECTQAYLEGDPERTSQTGFCTRAYLGLEGLYDVLFYLRSASNHNALVSHFTLAGVSSETALHFTDRFLGQAQWK